jgi:hypothetical protein
MHIVATRPRVQEGERPMSASGHSRPKARLADLGGAVLPGSPADFGKLIAEETAKWAKVVKFAGIKPIR